MSKSKRVKRINGNGNGTLEKRNGVWYVRYFDEVSGKRKRECTNETNREKAEIFQRNFMAEKKLVKSLDDKKTQLHHVKAMLESDINSQESELMGLKQIPIDDLWTRIFESEEFEDIRPDVEKQCRDIYKRFTNNFKTWVDTNFEGKVKFIADITEDNAKEFLRHREVTVSQYDRNKHFIWLRQAYRLFQQKKLVFKNPFANLGNIKNVKTTKKKIFSDEMIKKMDEVVADRDIQVRGIYMVGRDAGQRLGDCVRMKWEYFEKVMTDEGEKMFLVYKPSKTTKKAGTVVHCPLSNELIALLKELKEMNLESEEGYLFPEWARKYEKCSSNVDNYFLRIIDKAGIERKDKDGRTLYGFHSFRHTFVNRCVRAGIPVTSVMDMVGHKKADMTMHYALHHNINDSLKALEMLNTPIGDDSTKVVLTKEVVEKMDSMKGELDYSHFILKLMEENARLKAKEDEKNLKAIENIGNIIDKRPMRVAV